jgi:hypothetical protein
MRVCLCGAQWQPATENEISAFHADHYLSFLQQVATSAAAVLDEVTSFVLNQSVCFTESAWSAARAHARDHPRPRPTERGRAATAPRPRRDRRDRCRPSRRRAPLVAPAGTTRARTRAARSPRRRA